jgi:hypothetical protein
MRSRRHSLLKRAKICHWLSHHNVESQAVESVEQHGSLNGRVASTPPNRGDIVLLLHVSESLAQRPFPAIIPSVYPALHTQRFKSLSTSLYIARNRTLNGMRCKVRNRSLLLSLIDGILDLVNGRLAFRHTRYGFGQALKQTQKAFRGGSPRRVGTHTNFVNMHALSGRSSFLHG